MFFFYIFACLFNKFTKLHMCTRAERKRIRLLESVSDPALICGYVLVFSMITRTLHCCYSGHREVRKSVVHVNDIK